ncbi:MAG: hypothetical protein OXU75_05610 [Deltaproteobacteria bacterium]|nr:hypothetical protein [Deltaproteobacteria bacterium]
MVHIRFALLAVLAAGLLALSGCGSTKTKTVEVPGPTVEVPGPTVEVPVGPPDFVDLSGVPEDAMVADSESMDIEAGGSVTIGEVMYSCAAGDVDCTVTVEDGSAVSTGGAVTATVTQAYYTRVAEEKRVAAATKSAGTKEKAIAAEAGQAADADAGLGGSDHVNADGTDGNDDDPYRLSVKRDRMGTKIEITDHGMTDKEKDPQFAQAMDFGGGRTMHSRAMKADDDGNVESEVVIVMTDIQAPKATPFKDVHTLDTSTNTDNDTPSETYEALAIADTNAARALVKSSAFVAAPGVARDVLTFNADVTGTANTDEAFEVAGTYGGGPGTYRCNTAGTNCTVTLTRDDEGKVSITAMTGWIFTPAMGSMVDVPDADYLDYGFWLKRTTDSDGAVTYNEVETFARSSIDESTGTELDTVRGSAKYEGDAVGVYVHGVINSDGSRESATSGHFTADVNLTAIFGQVYEGANPSDSEAEGTIAPNMVNTVTGTINNFELSGGEANTWSVAVEADRATGANMFSGDAKGGMGDGSISGTFYGPTPETTVTTDGDRRDAPGSMAGEFNAGFTNGSVAGAFGARLEK